MSSRPSKRQKVDNGAHKSSPAPSLKPAKAPLTYGKQSKSSPAVNNTIDTSPDAKAEWFALKAQMKKRKAPQKAIGDLSVYDDFEGAHKGGSPYAAFQRGSAESKKKALDPLRNQRDVGESPQKAPGASLGFFKKFGKSQENLNDLGGAEKGADRVGADASNETASRIVSKGKGWMTTTGPPKKTFEDEMREIQEQARQQTRNDDSEDELAQQSGSKRASARRSGQRAASAKTTIPSAKAQPLDRRKEPSLREESLEIPESDEEDRMDVDRPDAQLTQDAPNEMEVEEEEIVVKPVVKPPVFKPVVAKRPTTPKKTLARPSEIAKARTIENAEARLMQDSAVKPTRKAVAAAKISFDEDHLQCIQKVVLEKTTGKRPILLTNLDDEYAKVATVITQTITAGESNSMLLIGARGCGKTAMINQIVRGQSKIHADDFHVVRLNGFIHTDDKIALREIWRQLGKEMELDEDEAVSKNYADTMTRLLALLSHPTENGIETEQVTKSVVFILDEFELFAGHPRQMLLYNLFDIAQSRKAPIAVLGLTTRIDVVESLEKRVKSRFSQRYVHLSLSKSFSAFEQICRTALTLKPDEMTNEETQLLAKDKTTTTPAIANWNSVMDQFLASDTCQSLLQRLYYTTKSVPDFLAAFTMALATLPTESQTTNSVLEHISTNITSASIIHAPDSKLNILHALSTLQLALLVCGARLTNIYDTELVTFALVYEEYKVIASKAKLQASASGGIASSRVWGKNVARNAWEELINAGLILEDGRSAGAKTGRVDVGLEELGGCGVELGGWGKWCKEI